MRKIKTYYGHLSQNDFDGFLTYSTGCLTSNANFPALPAALADITTMQKDWLKQLGLSKQGDHQATQKALELKNELASKVKKNGNYINNTADGDLAKLESSGYTLAKEPERKPKADIKIVQSGTSGAGNVVIHAYPDAICYLVDFCADPQPASGNNSVWWRLKLSSKSTLPFSGLEPRKLYWMKFTYLTINGEADYSQPKSFSVL
jgi:hypothetical protein